jgi:hypothetical protein
MPRKPTIDDVKKQNTRLVEMLAECIDCLEHSHPPEGLYTDKVVKKAHALLKEIIK